MIKVLFICGTRPEAIKLAPVIQALEDHPDWFTTRLCVTAQHRQMLDQVLGLFALTPDYDLDIMRPHQSLFDVTARGLMGLQEVLAADRPDLVVVQGDTTTTFLGALAAFYCKIPVAHVEAGLRTAEKYRPFPEEMNRRLTTHIGDWHFAPTDQARQSLLREGVAPETVWVTGNTVIDAVLTVAGQVTSPAEDTRWKTFFANTFSLGLHDQRRVVLVTGHRRESFGQGFDNICTALRRLALAHPEIALVYPVHLNPNVQSPVKTMLGDLPNVYLLPPLDYAPFVYLMQRCYLILTDSGGIQEEAPALHKPVLVMREVTERPEAVATGAAQLVGTEPDSIVSQTERLLVDTARYQAMAGATNPYGEGKAARRIAAILRELGR